MVARGTQVPPPERWQAEGPLSEIAQGELCDPPVASTSAEMCQVFFFKYLPQQIPINKAKSRTTKPSE